MRNELGTEKILAILSGVEQLPGLSCVLAEMSVSHPRLSICILDLSGELESRASPHAFNVGGCAVELQTCKIKQVLPTWSLFVPISFRDSRIIKKAQDFSHLVFGHLANPSIRLEKIASAFAGQLWSFGDAGVLFSYEFLHKKLTKAMLRHPCSFVSSIRLLLRAKSVAKCNQLVLNFVGVKTVNKTNHKTVEFTVGASAFREALLATTRALGLNQVEETGKLKHSKNLLLYPNFSSSRLLPRIRELDLVRDQMLAIVSRKEESTAVKFHPSMKPRFIKGALQSLSAAGYTNVTMLESRAPAEALIAQADFRGKVITFSINDRFLSQVSSNVVRAPSGSEAIALWHRENEGND